MTLDDRIDHMEERLDRIERQQQKIYNLALGIAIGLVIAALAFGIITLREVKEVKDTVL